MSDQRNKFTSKMTPQELGVGLTQPQAASPSLGSANPDCPLCQGLGSWVDGYPCDCRKIAPASPPTAPASAEVEELSAKFHEIYMIEARRQGDVRHKDAYADLTENVKEFDRVLARYVLSLLRTRSDSSTSAEEVAQQIYRECVYKTGMPEPPSQWVFALDKCAAMLRTHADSAVAEAVKQVKDFLFKQASSFPKNANGDFVSEASWNQAQALTDAAIAIGKLTPVTVRLASEERELVARIAEDDAVAEALKAAKEEAYKQSRESNDSAQVFICERIARRIDALTPATVRLAAEERELVARIEEMDWAFTNQTDLLLGQLICKRRDDITRQLAILRAKGGEK